MKSAIISLLAVVILSGSSSRTNPQPRRPLTPPDILRVANVSDPQISPNGSWVVYTVTTVDDDKNINVLWLAHADALITQPLAIPTPTPGRRPVPLIEWPEPRLLPAPLLASGW